MLKIIPLTDLAPSEADWLNQLFSAFESVDWCPYREPFPVEPNALYMFNLHSGMTLPEEWLNKIRLTPGTGLLHLGDEYLRSRLSEYGAFDYVIRMFPFPAVKTEGVKCVPIGYTRNLGPSSDKLASERKYPWMFAGDWKSDRSAMATAFQSWSGGLLSLPMPNEEANRISREAYLAGMAEAAFAPCPAGNIVLETCRPYEALHFGAIPLLPKRRHADPYLSVLGPHPMPTFETWEDARVFAQEVSRYPAALNALQTECLTWWRDAQKKWAEELKAFIEDGQRGRFSETLRSQFDNRPVSQLKRFKALVSQQNGAQIQQRASFRIKRAWRKLKGQKTEQPTWSIPIERTNQPVNEK